MRRRGFVLGFYSIGAQALLLRELISSLNGNELFIGTALFGWLVSVALGAYLGGKKHRPISVGLLFITGCIILPLSIIAVRMIPVLLNPVVGETVSFSSAVLISIIFMFPPGIISGWLFSVITKQGLDPGTAIIKVYLYEGLGAFAGGLLITLLAGTLFSTLALAFVLGVAILVVLFASNKTGQSILVTIIGLIMIFIAGYFSPLMDKVLDEEKYPGYEIIASFDTHFGHQAVLKKNNSYVLMTDNTIEATRPGIEIYENSFYPPLLYKPDAGKILYIGRGEFWPDDIDQSNVDFLDARKDLNDVLQKKAPSKNTNTRIENDPVSYFKRHDGITFYDIIIINAGGLDSYKSSRLLTVENMNNIKQHLKENGMLFIPTGYDTDRYITAEKAPILSAVYRTLQQSFKNVFAWPGTMTLFFASDDESLNSSFEYVEQMYNSFPFETSYIHPDYLFDRLAKDKVERLQNSLQENQASNRLEQPLLSHYQALYRSTAHDADRILMSQILNHPRWLWLIPLTIIILFYMMWRDRRNKNSYSMFLYFTAGAVSLSLELLSFYVYQSTAGALYSEIAVLIGAFMLGLSAGTYYAHKVDIRARIEQPALILLLAAALLFLSMYKHIGPNAALYFHLCFLFVTAVGTGTLFVGATNRYYAIYLDNNRGAGYAVEIIGSAIGALIVTTILLPVIGLTMLLLSIAGLIVLAIIGTILK